MTPVTLFEATSMKNLTPSFSVDTVCLAGKKMRHTGNSKSMRQTSQGAFPRRGLFQVEQLERRAVLAADMDVTAIDESGVAEPAIEEELPPAELTSPVLVVCFFLPPTIEVDPIPDPTSEIIVDPIPELPPTGGIDPIPDSTTDTGTDTEVDPTAEARSAAFATPFGDNQAAFAQFAASFMNGSSRSGDSAAESLTGGGGRRRARG